MGLVVGVESALQLISEFRHYFQNVPDDAVGGVLEDWRIRVVVDGNNHFRGVHAGQVLDGTGDAAGDVELRAHRFTGLSDLMLVVDPTGVHNGA